MSSSEIQTAQPQSRWFRFSLRTLLVLFTLIAVVIGIYEPLTLHLKALHFINVEKTSYSTRLNPEEILIVLEGADNAVLCHVGQVRIALLGRTPLGQTSEHVPIAGEAPRQCRLRSVGKIEYFSYSYAQGQAECVVQGFPFICREGTIQINDQSFDTETPTVILVDSDNKVIHTYSRER
ncbi:MAG: hypothetical protein P8J27_11390 [Mariniblastus sp.]|nr:hypothetical protein [Mariniblastus sp.]